MIDLSDLNEHYQDVIVGKFPEGTYPGRIVKAEVGLSKANRRQIVFEVEVFGFPVPRKILVKRYLQLDGGNPHYLNHYMKTLGLTLRDMNDLHEQLKGLTDKQVIVQLEHVGDWYAVTFLAPPTE